MRDETRHNVPPPIYNTVMSTIIGVTRNISPKVRPGRWLARHTSADARPANKRLPVKSLTRSIIYARVASSSNNMLNAIDVSESAALGNGRRGEDEEFVAIQSRTMEFPM